jgi:hypothetical protein
MHGEYRIATNVCKDNRIVGLLGMSSAYNTEVWIGDAHISDLFVLNKF